MAKISLKQIIILIFLSSLVIFFLTINTNLISTNSAGLLVFSLILGLFYLLWLSLSTISLAPFGILLLLIPYSYFYAPVNGQKAWITLGILLAGSLLLKYILNRKTSSKPHIALPLTLILLAYAIYFTSIALLRHWNFQNDSSFDVAIYSQLQWNNIHGHFFHTSFSGSNFVTHNSPFLILLSPFYLIYPHPETLLVLKTLCLVSSAWPLYLILKNYLNKESILPIIIGFLFFPFIVGQNFDAPHETCYLPPLLLFSFYFYINNRFKSFLFMLLLCLSVKEHMSAIAVMYGLYSIYLKKTKPWIMAPIILGISWGIFSIWLIHHFQSIYHVDPYPAWLIDNIQRRFLHQNGHWWSNLILGFQTSNIGHWCNFRPVYLLLSPLGLIMPFISSIWLLGLPELSINFLATIPLIYPTWHYNIVISIFLILSTAGAIQKLSLSFLPSKLKITSDRAQEFLAWFICICILSHFFLWSNYLHIKFNPNYVKTMNTAIAIIPQDASVSLTKHLAAYVTEKKDYFLCEDKRKGNYVLLDSNENLGDCLNSNQSKNYMAIFNQEGIRVYKNISQ